jgi:hypothetical protein
MTTIGLEIQAKKGTSHYTVGKTLLKIANSSLMCSAVCINELPLESNVPPEKEHVVVWRPPDQLQSSNPRYFLFETESTIGEHEDHLLLCPK